MSATTAAPTWESLSYGGSDPSGRLATWFAPHPETGRNVTLTYDRRTGATASRPRCPALEALARFATLVEDEHAALRRCRLSDRALPAVYDAQAAICREYPHDEVSRAMFAAIKREVRRRAALGPLAGAQAAGGVARLANAELFGEG